MEADSCRDYISKLPHDIVEVILTKLPIKEAVRTCILSRSWRYKWTSMSCIVLDNGVETNHDIAPIDLEMISFIRGFLSMHNGPIRKFSLSTDLAYESLGVEQWLPNVCQKDVNELTIQLGRSNFFRTPLCIFSCMKLTRLELQYCELRPPRNFPGFPCMKHLALRYVSIPREDIEHLISSCPLLESLALAYTGSSELTIRAPNLKRWNLEGPFIYIYTGDTPLLADMTVDYWIGELVSDIELLTIYSYMEELLGRIPKLERLCGKENFTKSLSAGGGRGRCEFITYEFLKHIELSAVRFDKPRDVLVALRLIFSAPNLKELYLQGDNIFDIDVPLDYFSADPYLADRTLDRLELVKVAGRPYELVCLKVIEFLLDRSPSLITMTIESWDRVRSVVWPRPSMRRDLSSFRRASEKSSIVIVDLEI